MPKVSVILPVYNVAEYLPKCVEALLNQTLSDIEIIFVDDCSPDNSADIIKFYTDPRIKLVRHKVNKYTAEARNSGLKIATGEYISFMDPDDWPEKDFLEKLYILAKEKNADIAKGVMRFMPSNKIRSRNKAIETNKFNFHFMMQSAIYRRELIEKHNIRFSIDVICGQFPMVYYANKIVTREDAIYNYLKRPGSCINQTFSVDKWQKLNIKGVEKTLSFINTHEITEENYILVATFLLGLCQYGYIRLSKEDQITSKESLNKHLDNFWNNLLYKNNSEFNTLYFNTRLKYV